MESRPAARWVRAASLDNPTTNGLDATGAAGTATVIDGRPAAKDGGGADAIARCLQQRFGAARFERYFGVAPAVRIAAVDAEGAPAALEIEVPTGFLATLLDRRFKAEVLAAACEATGAAPSDVRFIAVAGHGPETPASAVPTPESKPSARPATAPRAKARAQRLAVADRYNLAHFHPGEASGTRLAYEAAARLAAEEAAPMGLVYLHGACGTGKTHLMQGGALRFSQVRASATVRVVSADQFTTDYVAAVRTGKVESFRASLRGADLLCVDDVGVLAGRPSTQKELVYLLDAVAARGGRVCVTGHALPRGLVGLNDALVSRLAGGVVAEVSAPGVETRVLIASGVARRRGIELDPAAARVLAESLPASASVRDLEGLVVKVEAIHRLLDGLTGSGRVGVMTVKRALGSALDEMGRGWGRAGTGANSAGTFAPAGRPVRFGAILEAACAQIGVAEAEVMASGRHALVVMARSLSAYVARQATTMSFPEIARALGRPNHSTVITACQRVAKQIASGTRVLAGPERVEIGLAELAERILGAVRGGRINAEGTPAIAVPAGGGIVMMPAWTRTPNPLPLPAHPQPSPIPSTNA